MIKMKIIIDVPERYYNFCKECVANRTDTVGQHIIALGTPLPEHGRLIDADALTKRLEDMANLAWNIRVGSSTGLEDAIDVIDDAPTVIEGDKHEAEE